MKTLHESEQVPLRGEIESILEVWPERQYLRAYWRENTGETPVPPFNQGFQATLLARITIPVHLVLMVALSLPFMAGCATTRKGDNSGNLMPAARVAFQPYVRQVAVQAGEGRYPNLFTGASRAIWGGVDRPLAKPAMKKGPDTASTETMTTGNDADGSSDAMSVVMANAPGQPLVVACYLESQFPDMSIAYDAVGMRGMSIYLELPEGTQIPAVQKVLDPNLVDEPVGALRRYGRKITLYFPNSTIMVDNPAVMPASRGLRLVMEGYESMFYFEWPALPETTATARRPRWDEEALKTAKSAYRDVRSRVKRASHEVD